MPVVAGAKSDDTAWFIKVEQDLNERSESNIRDYGNIIPAGVRFFSEKFLGRICFDKNSQVFKISKQTIYFQKEIVVRPPICSSEGKQIRDNFRKLR